MTELPPHVSVQNGQSRAFIWILLLCATDINWRQRMPLIWKLNYGAVSLLLIVMSKSNNGLNSGTNEKTYNCIMKLNFFIIIFKVTGVHQRVSVGSLVSFGNSLKASWYRMRTEVAADSIYCHHSLPTLLKVTYNNSCKIHWGWHTLWCSK